MYWKSASGKWAGRGQLPGGMKELGWGSVGESWQLTKLMKEASRKTLKIFTLVARSNNLDGKDIEGLI